MGGQHPWILDFVVRFPTYFKMAVGEPEVGAGNPHPREHIQAVVGASISNGAHAWCLGRRLRSTMGSIVDSQ